jgi:hypothetical protein
MSSSTFTRYQCDWCRAEVEFEHTGSLGLPERPREWGRAQIEEAPLDLCAYCAEALRALAASRSAAGGVQEREPEFAPS